MQRPKVYEHDIHNIYKFISEKPKDVLEATKKTKAILRKAVKQLKTLEEKYPDCGFGDTETDESVTTDFYSILHWGEE